MEGILIKNTNFSIQFILDQIRRSFDLEGAQNEQKSKEWSVANQLDSFEAIDITGGAAFMSSILKVTFHWKEPKKGHPFPDSVVLKIPGPKYNSLVAQNGREEQTDNAMEEESSDYLIKAHTNEILFYKNFPRFDASLRLPKFYFGSDYSPSHNNGLIIMEDLSSRASSLLTLPGFDDVHVLAVIDELSKVHAISWKHGELKQLFPIEIRPSFIESMRSNAKQLAKIEPNQVGPLIDRLLSMFNVDYYAMALYTGDKYGFPSCIVHSDLWSPNILWEKNANGEPSDRLCAIIDWQTVHDGNPCNDLSRLLALNTPGQYRRENTGRLLEYYAKKVAEQMGGTAPFTTEQLRVAYKHSLPFSMMYLCFGASCYYHMESVIGKTPNEQKDKRTELLQRVRMFLEDTIDEFGM
ncbi:hypothetical protein niasHT_024328 [Heterodera trifolii]|uniref:CHK kinase-like domain-containing protein n=1 Tax=Heterodera trifolii TaxID=157864 RepID=A0ABD2JMA4_9BILA